MLKRELGAARPAKGRILCRSPAQPNVSPFLSFHDVSTRSKQARRRGWMWEHGTQTGQRSAAQRDGERCELAMPACRCQDQGFRFRLTYIVRDRSQMLLHAQRPLCSFTTLRPVQEFCRVGSCVSCCVSHVFLHCVGVASETGACRRHPRHSLGVAELHRLNLQVPRCPKHPARRRQAITPGF